MSKPSKHSNVNEQLIGKLFTLAIGSSKESELYSLDQLIDFKVNAKISYSFQILLNQAPRSTWKLQKDTDVYFVSKSWWTSFTDNKFKISNLEVFYNNNSM